ncbi:DUF2798 domain-containing protein [Ochrobactrum sp. BD67]
MSQFECARRRKLPARYASIVMPFILSIMMTFIVSLIATAKSLGLTNPDLASSWMGAWGLSWVVAFPVLLAILPVVRRLVAIVCHSH